MMGRCNTWFTSVNVICGKQQVDRSLFFNRGSAEPKDSVSARQGFHRWPVENKNKAEINNKVTWVTSNLGYSDHTSLFLIWATITMLHTYTCINRCFFVQITKYRKMLFLSVWNRTNRCVTTWVPRAIYILNTPKGSIPIKRLKTTAIDFNEVTPYSYVISIH